MIYTRYKTAFWSIPISNKCHLSVFKSYHLCEKCVNSLQQWRCVLIEASGVTAVRLLVCRARCFEQRMAICVSELEIVFFCVSKSPWRESLRVRVNMTGRRASLSLAGKRGTVLRVHWWTPQTRRRCTAESPESLCWTPPVKW